jgi:hypothetical protein
LEALPVSAVFAWRDQYDPDVPILSFCCSECEFSLTLHQPDPELPDRFIATCDECKAWYLATSEGSSLTKIANGRCGPWRDD